MPRSPIPSTDPDTFARHWALLDGRWKTDFGLLAFLASETLIKQIPRLLGPGLSKGTSPPRPNGSIIGPLANEIITTQPANSPRPSRIRKI